MGRLMLRRTSDGALHVLEDAPDDHYFSARWIADRLKDGEVEVTVTLKAEGGDVSWDLVGLEGEDGEPNTVSWHVRKDG